METTVPSVCEYTDNAVMFAGFKTAVGLGDRMKIYEHKGLELVKLDPKQPIIVRVDGKKFSSFTRGFKKPYDERITSAMKQTCIDLMHEFQPQTVYSQSDEISLVFYNADAIETFAGGRATKIATLVASYCAVRFNHHLNEQIKVDELNSNDRTIKKIKSNVAYFDGRAFNLPVYEVLNYIVWRSNYDARRNSILNYSRSFFSDRDMHGKKTPELCKMLIEIGKPWEDLPMELRLGFFIKKTTVEKQMQHPKTGEQITVKRNEYKILLREITHYTEEYSQWLLAKTVDSSNSC
ncbi:tRNAHis guanylyltransferase Thg1 [Pacmanvirus A23]|uniref:tRNA-His guanylyltransferase n=1 Tax=Pacmanvirus A23 TaxID=1932881 RepID=UPI000A09306B|nr:tRNA-His guanylyltransferase [Pacmanvirus A23]SIP85816.1 tRNAHis guanylyltransferase Thg1 [Pacmanvirus A23]